MAALLTPNEILSLSAQAARRLLSAGDGDAALLYLALLESGGDTEKARAALGWDHPRLTGAHLRLVRLELAEPPSGAPVPAEPVPDQPPAYSRADILSAMEGEVPFPPLCREMERCLGRPLGETDLKSLYTIYDYLALPPEVILLLANWCAAEAERKFGAGRRPRMGDVKREAFRWKRLGLDTVEGAEHFLRRQQQLAGRERELLPLLGIRDRLPLTKEREYLSAWVDMGFADDAIQLAYERTLFQKQQMNWPYMNSILKRWHQAGLHTAAQVRAGDTRPAPARGRPVAPAPAGGNDRQSSARQLKKDVDWMDQFLNEQKG